MGWLFTPGQSRSQLIERLVRHEDNERARHVTLAHCVRGNVLWTVREVTFKTVESGYLPGFPQRYIGCDLMACQRGFGWGYKDLCESMGPCYYHCPLAYLDMVPEANAEWRAAVRLWHERHSRPIRVGEIWSIVPGYSVRAVEIVCARPLRGRGRHDGVVYRIRRDLLDFRQQDAAPESEDVQLPLPAVATEAVSA